MLIAAYHIANIIKIFFKSTVSYIDAPKNNFVLELGARPFTITGPVMVYGTVTSVVYGVILCVLK